MLDSAARKDERLAVAVCDVRQETSDEGLGWSKLLQQECDYHFCAGVEVLAFALDTARCLTRTLITCRGRAEERAR